MTLLFADGFDTYSQYNPGTLSRWTYTYDSDVFPRTPFNSGTGRGNPPGNALYISDYRRYAVKVLPGYSTTLTAGFAYYNTGQFPAGFQNLIGFMDIANSFNYQIFVQMAATGILTVQRGGAIVMATSNNPVLLAGQVWHYIEFQATINNSATVGGYALRIDGQVVAGIPDVVAGANTRHATSLVNGANAVMIGSGQTVGGLTLWDDFYLCDNLGSVNNGFLGDTRIIGLRPVGPGTYSQWTPVGAGQNWSVVADKATAVTLTTPDGDASYVMSNAVGAKDSYTYEDLPGGLSLVRAVVSGPFIRREDGAARTVAPLIKNGSAEANGPVLTASQGIYSSALSVMETNPNTSAPWTVADINASEFGLTLVS